MADIGIPMQMVSDCGMSKHKLSTPLRWGMERVFLVTGASKGIGRSVAIGMAKKGFVVIGLARNSDELESLSMEIKHYNTKSTCIACDMGNIEEINNSSKIILENYSHLSGIIHNAGTIHPIRGIFESDFYSWNRSISVNLCGVQSLTSNLQKLLGGNMPTRITTISSGASRNAVHGWSSYCVSKAGLDMWTMCLAEEGTNRNISAVAVAPGIVDTGMQEEIRDSDIISFPRLNDFIGFKRDGDLTDPDEVAAKLIPIFTGEIGENGQRLDIRNL